MKIYTEEIINKVFESELKEKTKDYLSKVQEPSGDRDSIDHPSLKSLEKALKSGAINKDFAKMQVRDLERAGIISSKAAMKFEEKLENMNKENREEKTMKEKKLKFTKKKKENKIDNVDVHDKYSESIMKDVWKWHTSGIHKILEEEIKKIKKESIVTKQTPKYIDFKVDNDNVSIDIVNKLIYINDELVVPDTDSPQHTIDVLSKILPEVLASFFSKKSLKDLESIKEIKDVKVGEQL